MQKLKQFVPAFLMALLLVGGCGRSSAAPTGTPLLPADALEALLSKSRSNDLLLKAP